MRFFSIKKKRHKPFSADKVRFSYEDKEILKNISLNLKKGTITSIIGSSGCGKSTFLNLAAGIISKKHSGKIRIFGKSNIFKKKSIGFVPQEIAVIPDLTINDNIKIAGLNHGISSRVALGHAKYLLQTLRLSENTDKKPTELSGGQKVRLNIILSVLHDPDIFILDEPFVGLDFQNRRLLWHFLEQMKNRGKTILLTSHLLSETQEHANSLIILKEGRIYFKGTVTKLKEKLDIKPLIVLS